MTAGQPSEGTRGMHWSFVDPGTLRRGPSSQATEVSEAGVLQSASLTTEVVPSVVFPGDSYPQYSNTPFRRNSASSGKAQIPTSKTPRWRRSGSPAARSQKCGKIVELKRSIMDRTARSLALTTLCEVLQMGCGELRSTPVGTEGMASHSVVHLRPQDRSYPGPRSIRGVGPHKTTRSCGLLSSGRTESRP